MRVVKVGVDGGRRERMTSPRPGAATEEAKGDLGIARGVGGIIGGEGAPLPARVLDYIPRLAGSHCITAMHSLYSTGSQCLAQLNKESPSFLRTQQAGSLHCIACSCQGRR